MGKNKPVKKASKTAVKVSNKKQNKANKSRKNKPSNKARNASNKANNLSLHKQRQEAEAQEEAFEEAQIAEVVKPGQFVGERSALKRKRIEELNQVEECEANYKVKDYYMNGMKADVRRAFSLPIKTESGLMVKAHDKHEIEEAAEAEEVEQKKPAAKVAKIAKPNNKEVKAERPKTALELIQEKKQILDKNKEKIASYSRDILQNPQDELKKLKELRQMVTYGDIKSSLILRKLLVVSLAEIFKDIIPSYKIRQWSDKETEQSVSKEVKTLKEYEETLCKQYKLYIDYIGESMREVNKTLGSVTKQADLDAWTYFGVVCIKSLTGLLETKSHFNFTSDVIQIVVQQLTHRNQEIFRLAADSIRKLYGEDKTLQLSLEITQKIARLLKQKSFGVKPAVLNVFLALRLREIQLVEEDPKSKKSFKERQKLSRQDRKKIKEKAQLSHDLEENELKDKLRAKNSLQTRILEQIFLVYFNILKKAPNFKLIPSVLEGLSRFAHLINLEFFDDIIKIMHEMIEADRLSFRSKLHCIKTVFVVLSGRGEALTVDPMRFYGSLYNILLRLDVAADLDSTVVLAECIDMMFFKRRKSVPSARLLAFIKRLSTAAIHMDATSAAIVLDLIRKLCSLNPNSDLLFDNDYQNSGIYQPEGTQPDYANAQNSALWELHLMRNHYSKPIANEAFSLLKDQTLTFQDTKRSHEEIIAFMEAEEQNAMEKKSHPNSRNKNRNFISDEETKLF